MSFLNSLQQESSRTGRTENGALTHTTTHNEVLDFFALAGGMRNNVADARKLFRKAFAVDPQLAVRALFYIRDIRGGQGERDLFRGLFDELPVNIQDNLLPHISVFGRWDDLWAVAGVSPRTVPLIERQLLQDEVAMARGESVSLLGKWLPSTNTSSDNTRAVARNLARQLGMTEPEYRRRVVALRKHIKLLEHKMSANEWSDIDYSHLPSQAGRKHTKAFRRHDQERYDQYLEDVMSGKATMNASTIFTYEVYDLVQSGQSKAADALWKSLPDFTNGSNALVVADTSGSMWGRPLSISVSLALYFAERNQGAFKDYFITFSENPNLQKVVGKTLTERMNNIRRADWGMSTNIQAVFDLVLNAAVKSKATQEDMPSTLYLISDMEFNQATNGNKKTNIDVARRKFIKAGYKLPTICFWNVSARNTNVPATLHDGEVVLVSGLSQSTFRYVVEGKSPEQLMLEVLNSERYSAIVI